MKIFNRISKSLMYHYGTKRAKIFGFIYERTIWYKSVSLIAHIYHFFTCLRYGKKKSFVKYEDVKKVAVVYSTRHFNPKDDNKQYSASMIARHVYNTFKDKEILYFDHSRTIDEIPKVDLIVGIVSKNLIKLAKANPQAGVIAFLVNCHPLFRLKTLVNESITLKKKLPFSEYVSPFLFLNTVKYVNRFMLVGNDFVKKTFTDYKIPSEMITIINTGANELLSPNMGLRPKDKLRIVYVGSHLAIRKGLFRVIQVWDQLMKEVNPNDFELIIIGGMDVFKSEMDDFLQRHRNTKFLGWIESNTSDYMTWIQSAHIIINLSLEEGQVGCVLDGMACGAIPIITEESGIGITDGREGYIVRHDDIETIVKRIQSLKDDGARKVFEENCPVYISSIHNWQRFEKELAETVKAI